MKQKLKIDTLLWSLIMILGFIGLEGCNKDNEYLKNDIYQGFIQDINQDTGEFTIKITTSPFQKDIPFDSDKIMPLTKDELSVSLANFPNTNPTIKQKLLFRFVSGDFFQLLAGGRTYWYNCNIIILKIY